MDSVAHIEKDQLIRTLTVEARSVFANNYVPHIANLACLTRNLAGGCWVATMLNRWQHSRSTMQQSNRCPILAWTHDLVEWVVVRTC